MLACVLVLAGCSSPEPESADASVSTVNVPCADAGAAAVDATVTPIVDATAPPVAIADAGVDDDGFIPSPPFVAYGGEYIALCDSRCRYTVPCYVEIAGYRLGNVDVDNAGEGGLTMKRLDEEFDTIARPHIIGDGGAHRRVCSVQGGYDDCRNENADAAATGAHFQSIVRQMRDAGCDYVISLLEPGGVNVNAPWLDPYRAMQAEAGADDVEDPCGDVWFDAWYGDGGGGAKVEPWSVDGLHGTRAFEACKGDRMYAPLVRAFR